MKASEIIRGLLDLMDQIDSPEQQPVVEPTGSIEIVVPADDVPETLPAENPLTKPSDANHFKQIFDILSANVCKLSCRSCSRY